MIMKITKQIKKLIILLILTISIVFLSIDSKSFANSPDDTLEVYFTLNGNTEISREDFIENIVYEKYITLELMLKPTGNTSMPISAIGFVMDDNDLFKSISTITLTKEKLPVPPFTEQEIWNAQASSSYNNPGLIFNIIRSIAGDFSIPEEGYKIADVMFELNETNVPDNQAFSLRYDDFGAQSFVYNSDGSNVILPPFVIGDPDSGPDASLSSLKVAGESTTYLNLTNDIEVDPFIHEVTVSYADNKIENGIAIIASPKKAGADVQMSGIKSSYTTGDIITIQVTDDSDTKTYKIKINVTEANDDTSVTFT